MSDYRNMSARQLRKVAPHVGLTGASRMKQDRIVSWIEQNIATMTPEQRELVGAVTDGDRPAGSMTRAQRDALRRQPRPLYDPAASLPDDLPKRSRAGLPRFDRRHITNVTRPLHAQGRPIVSYTTIKRRRRERGLMVPATRLDLVQAKAALA